MLRILMADDHPVVRQGFRNLLRNAGGFAPPLEAATCAAVLALVQADPPDMVVMNTTLLDADSLETLRAIKQMRPALPVILLHPEPDPDYARQALASGASGIVTKLSPDEELLVAIRTVAAGGAYVCALLAARMNGHT